MMESAAAGRFRDCDDIGRVALDRCTFLAWDRKIQPPEKAAPAHDQDPRHARTAISSEVRVNAAW
ncbi:hypothetical protein ACFFP0_05270 [Rhizobium puerariae]|uniref:DUF982 domain-containing protein n=1 Tax=Rhizobium puerariae TaxID=1585791 RepID=A0ABV6AEE6_9HYPH